VVFGALPDARVIPKDPAVRFVPLEASMPQLGWGKPSGQITAFRSVPTIPKITQYHTPAVMDIDIVDEIAVSE
jgi:hypothetical protein